MKERASPIPSYTYFGYTCYGYTCYSYTCYGCTCYGWLYLLRLYLLQERASSISRVVDSVLSTVAATCDWAEEACHACTMHIPCMCMCM
eukprot:scaffold85562_cov69-Phaeocystis_antarctica.AAC.3